MLPPALRERLAANDRAAREARRHGRALDPAPLVKFFNPRGIAIWLATDIDSDGDTLAGLVDLGRGRPERSLFSLGALAALRLPEGVTIVRDPFFASLLPLSIWADAARAAGSILWVELMLRPRPASAAARRAATGSLLDAGAVRSAASLTPHTSKGVKRHGTAYP